VAGGSGDPISLSPHPQSVVSRVANLPLVSSAYDMVSSAYSCTKESHPYVRSVCDAAEKGVKTLTAAAVSGAQPLLTRLEPQISSANEFACKGLDKLEEKLPILQQPPERVTSPGGHGQGSSAERGAGTSRPCAVPSQVVAGTRELLSCAVSGAVARTRSALGAVVGTGVGRLLATGVGTVLGKSEELLDRYLPGTDEELGTEVTMGTEVAAPEWQKRWQSYFIRVGSLSAKLPHRALRHSLGDLQRARHRTQRLLAQLHHLIQLIEEGQRGTDGPWHSTQERLHRLWLEWSQQDAAGLGSITPSPCCLLPTPQVEARTLAMLRGLLHQLHAACSHLAAGARAFPSSVQETAGHVRHGVEGIQASLASACSFQELSGLVLAQSRDTVTRAQLNLEGLLEHVGQHTPLPWLVGPFAPALVEYPEDVPVE
ncbi:PLIN3 protein, partial [Falcunculus frontatus]|nr:PLIN3 protein [Falcunculus frontatus]